MPAPEDLDLDPDGEQHPAEQRIQRKQETQAQRELAIVDAGLSLDKDKRAALLAVVGEDMSPENLKAKAEALGFVEPEAAAPEGPTAEQLAADAAQLGRMNQAAAFAPPPPAPLAPMQQVMEKASRIANPAVLGELYSEAVAAIRSTPGLVFGEAEALSGFAPL